MATNNIGAPFSLMTDQPSIPKISRATWMGLFLSLFAMVVIRYAFVFFVPEITFAAAILKETLIWQAQRLFLSLSGVAKVCRLSRLALAHVARGNQSPGDS